MRNRDGASAGFAFVPIHTRAKEIPPQNRDSDHRPQNPVQPKARTPPFPQSSHAHPRVAQHDTANALTGGSTDARNKLPLDCTELLKVYVVGPSELVGRRGAPRLAAHPGVYLGIPGEQLREAPVRMAETV